MPPLPSIPPLPCFTDNDIHGTPDLGISSPFPFTSSHSLASTFQCYYQVPFLHEFTALVIAVMR